MRLSRLTDTVNLQRLFQNVANGMARIQRTVRILKHHLHLAATLLTDVVIQPLTVDIQLALPVVKQPDGHFQHHVVLPETAPTRP